MKGKSAQLKKAVHSEGRTMEWLKSKLSTSKFGKTERANSFLADPAAFSTEEPEKGEIRDVDTSEVEPWLEAYEANDETTKLERAIRNEINAILGITSDGAAEKNPSNADMFKIDSNLITKKMKKYQPANSSFSLFYGEKRGYEKLHGEDIASQSSARSNSNHKFKLPIIPIKKSSKDMKPLKDLRSQKKSPFFSVNSLSRASEGKSFEIVSQLQQIEKAGEVLTDYSSRLIHKIDRVTDIVDERFAKLSQVVNEMVADVGTYHLQEQTSGAYKKEMFSTPLRLLKK